MIAVSKLGSCSCAKAGLGTRLHGSEVFTAFMHSDTIREGDFSQRRICLVMVVRYDKTMGSRSEEHSDSWKVRA